MFMAAPDFDLGNTFAVPPLEKGRSCPGLEQPSGSETLSHPLEYAFGPLLAGGLMGLSTPRHRTLHAGLIGSSSLAMQACGGEGGSGVEASGGSSSGAPSTGDAGTV